MEGLTERGKGQQAAGNYFEGEKMGQSELAPSRTKMKHTCRRLLLMSINELIEVNMKSGAGEEVLSSKWENTCWRLDV